MVGEDDSGNLATSTLQTFSTTGCSSGGGSKKTTQTPTVDSKSNFETDNGRAGLEKKLVELMAQYKALTGRDFSAGASQSVITIVPT